MTANETKQAGKLKPRDQQIAALIAAGKTYAETAAQLNLSEMTIKRMMMRPEVRAEVDAIRGRAIEAGLSLLCADFTDAVSALKKLRQEGTPKDSVRLGAVKLTIESVLRVRDHVQLSREIAELREMLNEPAGGTQPPQEDRRERTEQSERSGDTGSAASGPSTSPEPSGNCLGPMASQPDAGTVEALPAVGLSTGWQE